MTLKEQLQDDMKAAMRGHDKARLGVIRLALAAVKQREVDERITLDDAAVLGVLDKMLKQRRDSVAQYEAAGREDLAAQERFEIEVISAWMPQPLEAAQLDALIDAAIAETGASSMRDMGAVMGIVRPQVAGRADMGAVSARVKARLG